MLDEIAQLSEAGFAVHWLRPRSKAPAESDWSHKPVYGVDDLRRTRAGLEAHYGGGLNVGVRLGEPSKVAGLFLHCFDVDVRDAALVDDAYDALEELCPEFETFPCVESGSGGASRHFYFLTERPFHSRVIAKSEGRHQSADGVWHRDWEIEIFGTGKQVVLPPSIHPSGRPYKWLTEFDFDNIGLGRGPVIRADEVAGWAAEAERPAAADDDEDLSDYLNRLPADVSDEQVTETLALLPLPTWCDDRDGWLQVGMALHHQFEGADKGFDLWNEFSRKSAKFNPRDQRRVWKSFSAKAGGVRFPTLIKAAEAEKARLILAEHAPDPDSDEDDLIGGTSDTPAPDAKPGMTIEDVIACLDKGEKGIKATLFNLALIIRHDPRTRGLPAFNQFTNEIVQRRAPGKQAKRLASKPIKQLNNPVWKDVDPVNGRLWNDSRDTSVREMIEAPVASGGYGIKVADRDLMGAIDTVAKENSFHPVREYLTSLEWDGIPRVETLFIDYLGAEDTPYARQVARMLAVAAVARTFEPGHKFDFAVILEGLQGKRKSTFIQVLARRWFAELDGDFHDPKSMVEIMQGSWILEIPELSGFGRSDVRQIKAFISRSTDKVRLAYARRAENYPRQCIFIGSTNDSTYLRDDTGGRRFWPIACDVDQIDTEALSRVIDLFWAEALSMYRDMRIKQPRGDLPLYLSDAAAASQGLEMQESRRVETAEDALAGKIGVWLDKPMTDAHGFDEEDDLIDGPVIRNETCLMEIWIECLGRDASQYLGAQSQQLGAAMRKIPGWAQKGFHRHPRYGHQRMYRRIIR